MHCQHINMLKCISKIWFTSNLYAHIYKQYALCRSFITASHSRFLQETYIHRGIDRQECSHYQTNSISKWNYLFMLEKEKPFWRRLAIFTTARSLPCVGLWISQERISTIQTSVPPSKAEHNTRRVRVRFAPKRFTIFICLKELCFNLELISYSCWNSSQGQLAKLITYAGYVLRQ